MPKTLSRPFLIALVLITLFACYFVFKPFLIIIVIAAIFATIFYKPYGHLTVFLKGRKNLAAFLMCLFLVILIILPTIKLVVYGAESSVRVYYQVSDYFQDHSVYDVLDAPIFKKLHINSNSISSYDRDQIKEGVLNFLQKSSDLMISSVTSVITGTANFVISLALVILMMFFFFIDGKDMLNETMYLLPLPDKYNKEIFNKFKEISYTTMISTFVVALGQGVVGAIGFAFVGFPPFLAGILVAILSLLPYIGSAIFYIPAGLYYLLMGQTWQGIFIILWGFLIIGTIDNVIRAWMLKDKAQVNPMFIIFSVIGGISLFGFWGIVLGPLVVAITVTVLHIYSLEFASELDATSDRVPNLPVIISNKSKNKKKDKK